MIIKTISHSSIKLSRMQLLVDYIYDRTKIEDKVRGKKRVIVKQFLRGYDHKKYGEQFKQNDDGRNYNYGTRRTTIRHEVLSFHEDSEIYLTESTLKTIAITYIKKRCPKSLATAVVHYDSQPHIHIAWSAVDITGNPTRITQQSFAEFKRDFQAWQERTFPELHRSIVQHGKKKPCHFSLTKKNNT